MSKGKGSMTLMLVISPGMRAGSGQSRRVAGCAPVSGAGRAHSTGTGSCLCSYISRLSTIFCELSGTQAQFRSLPHENCLGVLSDFC